MSDSLVRITPRTLREKLQYTDNINGVRDMCQTSERIISERLIPVYRKAMLDLALYGNCVVSIEDWYKR